MMMPHMLHPHTGWSEHALQSRHPRCVVNSSMALLHAERYTLRARLARGGPGMHACAPPATAIWYHDAFIRHYLVIISRKIWHISFTLILDVQVTLLTAVNLTVPCWDHGYCPALFMLIVLCRLMAHLCSTMQWLRALTETRVWWYSRSTGIGNEARPSLSCNQPHVGPSRTFATLTIIM